MHVLPPSQGDPANFDDAIAAVREQVNGTPPAGLEGAKFLMLVDRATGKGYGLTLYATEDARRRGDEALNAHPGGDGTRVSVEFFDVPVTPSAERSFRRAGDIVRAATPSGARS